MKAVAQRAVDAHGEALVALSRRIHANPELAWQEERAAGGVAGALSDLGYRIEERYTGLDTAFAARLGSGPLHLAICAESTRCPVWGTPAATT